MHDNENDYDKDTDNDIDNEVRNSKINDDDMSDFFIKIIKVLGEFPVKRFEWINQYELVIDYKSIEESKLFFGKLTYLSFSGTSIYSFLSLK